jgi:hypothetical protein
MRGVTVEVLAVVDIVALLWLVFKLERLFS